MKKKDILDNLTTEQLEMEMKALDILEEYEATIPIDVTYIAKCLGYKVEEEILTTSGNVDKNEKKISVDIFDSVNRKRFTIAHEIGHIILHKNLETANRSSDNSGKEREANSMAGAIIMPLPNVITEFLQLKEENMQISEIIRKMADNYKVSESAIDIRLKNLKLISW